MAGVIKEWKAGARPIEEALEQGWDAVMAGEGDAKDLQLISTMIKAKGCGEKEEALLTMVVGCLERYPAESVEVASVLHEYLKGHQRTTLLGSVLGKVAVQNLDQCHRLAVFDIIRRHLQTDDVPPTAAFVNDFIKAIDGERDPRCLLLTFAVHSAVTVKLGKVGIASEDPTLLEEMFDVVSCYFPISYTPPKKEKNPVSNTALKQNVLKCCTHPCFSDFAIPFALDKLSSPLSETKLDSLQMINECCTSYEDGEMLIEPYFSELWTQIRTETLNASMRGDDLLMHSLFKTVTCIAQVIAKYKTDDLLHAHLKLLFDGVLNMASVPQGFVNAKTYSALVHFTASAAPNVLNVIVNRLIPVLHSGFLEKPDDINRRVSILGIYNAVLGAAAKLNVPVEVDTMEDAVFSSAEKGITTEGMILCGEACSSIMQFGTKSSPRAAECLVSILLNITENESRVMVIKALQAAVVKTPSLTSGTVIPKLLAAPAFDSERAQSALLSITSDVNNLMHVISQTLTVLVSEATAQHALCVAVLNKIVDSSMQLKPVSPSGILTAATVSGAVAKCGKELHGALQLALGLLSEEGQMAVLDECKDKEVWYSLVCGVRKGVEVALDASAVTGDMSKERVLAIASCVNKSQNSKMPVGFAASPHVGLLLKAGVMKGDEESMQALVEMVTNNTEVSGVLSTVFSDMPSLGPVLGHVRKFLWSQKVYAKILPVLLMRYKSETDETKKGHIFESVAVTVSHAPAALVSADAEKLLPVVTGGLSCENGGIVASSLDILHTLVQQDPAAVAKIPLLSLLVPSLLRASAYKPRKNIRTTALNILNLIATDKHVAHAAVSFKQQVVAGLIPVLDDPKRMVRAAATEARCSWYLLA